MPAGKTTGKKKKKEAKNVIGKADFCTKTFTDFNLGSLKFIFVDIDLLQSPMFLKK